MKITAIQFETDADERSEITKKNSSSKVDGLLIFWRKIIFT